VLPGQILRELTENARVVGGITPDSAKAGRELYRIFVKGEIIETDTTTAEMVKLMENTTRDINIAIANEFSRLAEHFGVDIWEAISLANRHPRINILSPGPGVGGHCISVDPWFFVEAAPELASLIYQARQVNDAQPHFVVEKVNQSFARSGAAHQDSTGKNALSGKRIAALGLAYKPDVADLRESPAIEVVHLLLEKGAEVTAWEPFSPDANMPGIQTASSLDSAIRDADAILLLVKHTEFKNFNPEDIAARTKARIAIDTVNAWDTHAWEKAGFQLYRLGARQLTLPRP
jgi:UDP-N-acetyl-D-mannosaminuronic acid dehydrogenase